MKQILTILLYTQFIIVKCRITKRTLGLDTNDVHVEQRINALLDTRDNQAIMKQTRTQYQSILVDMVNNVTSTTSQGGVSAPEPEHVYVDITQADEQGIAVCIVCIRLIL
jgi:hypothetical protein